MFEEITNIVGNMFILTVWENIKQMYLQNEVYTL